MVLVIKYFIVHLFNVTYSHRINSKKKRNMLEYYSKGDNSVHHIKTTPTAENSQKRDVVFRSVESRQSPSPLPNFFSEEETHTQWQ